MNRTYSRRGFLQSLGVTAAGAAASGAITGLFSIPSVAEGTSQDQDATARRRPNFVFILVDDLGWTDLACCGSQLYETPNIDRLAARGVRFTDAYAAGPVCSPTRAAIMTGKHPARLEITDWIPGDRPQDRKLVGPPIRNELPLEEVTLAEALKAAGYATFFCGKWHLGGKGFYPEQQGFDENKGGFEAGYPVGGYYTPYQNPKLPDGPVGEYLTDRLTEESLRFMARQEEKPFFLFHSFYTVHSPIQACVRHIDACRGRAASQPSTDQMPELREREAYTRSRHTDVDYASMVRSMDENVGRILDKLEELGIADNTVVIFTSDNGGLSTLPWKWAPTANQPLRAGKGWCYEGGIRVPLIIRTPGVTHGGRIVREPVTSMDFYPTILELANLPGRPTQHCDGMSLAPLLREKQAVWPRNELYWHYPHYHTSQWTPGAAVRAGDWKLIDLYDEGRIELYNLAVDLGEQVDLAAREPEKASELRRLLQEWQRKVGARMPKPNPRGSGGHKDAD